MTVTGDFFEPPRGFFARDSLELAPDLLGCLLEHTTADGAVTIRITEVEAYAGELDPGSHAYRGQTARNSTMFGEAGHVYAYFTYGMHHAVNLVAGGIERPRACLVRSGEVVDGAQLARQRREGGRRRSALPDRDLARGPGNVAQALGVTLEQNGDDLFGGAWRFLVPTSREWEVSTGPRVGVSGPGGDAASFPWRYWISGDPTVSAYRAAVVRTRRATP